MLLDNQALFNGRIPEILELGTLLVVVFRICRQHVDPPNEISSWDGLPGTAHAVKG